MYTNRKQKHVFLITEPKSPDQEQMLMVNDNIAHGFVGIRFTPMVSGSQSQGSWVIEGKLLTTLGWKELGVIDVLAPATEIRWDRNITAIRARKKTEFHNVKEYQLSTVQNLL